MVMDEDRPMRDRGRPLRGVLLHGLPPARALAIGLGAVVVIGLSVNLLEEHLGRPAQALLLVMPVAVTGVLGGRRAAFVVAAAATLCFTVTLPPKGSLAVRVTDDLVALAVFSIVAVTVGELVAHRIEVLGRVERQRAALLRSVSHDLRTPLATIVAAASELRDEDAGAPPERQRLLDAITSEAARLDHLVADLLSLARIEAGALRPNGQAVDVDELLRETVARMQPPPAVPVHVEVETDLPILHADYTLLEQVVRNLVDNAARHAPAGTTVDVRGTALDGTIEITVRDHGAGVPDHLRATIFDAFRSGDGPGGSGIGLAICKAVAEAHDGTIAVRDGVGGGAEFVVTLPFR